MQKTRVLIVEDESIIASDIASSLAEMGYEVAGIEVSGVDAIGSAHRIRPDIVLMDIVLQDEMDGIQAAGHIRNELNIPVIFLSAYAEEKVLERAKLTDPFGYLIKPFENKELHFSIQMALYKFTVQEELKRVNRALKTLSNCNQALVHATDEMELLKEICRIIVEVGGYALSWVALTGQDGSDELTPIALSGRDMDSSEVLNLSLECSGSKYNPVGAALRSRMPISVQDIASVELDTGWADEMSRLGFASCIALPLLVNEEPIGILCISASDPHAFDAEEFDQMVDLANNLSYWIVSLRNRNKHKAAEEALLASHERFIAVMDSIDAIVYVADMDTRDVLFANKYVRDKFGYVPGRPCWSVFQGLRLRGPCEFCTNDFLLDERGAPAAAYQWEFRNPDTGRWYEMRDRAIRWVDGRTVRLEIATDITVRKEVEAERERQKEQLEELVAARTEQLSSANVKLQREINERKRAEEELLKAQKLESMGILAGGIAHDFNNILTSILSNISLAKMLSGAGDSQFMKLMAAEKATLRARGLTQQLLTFSKSGAPIKRTASIVDIIRDSAEFVLMGSNVKLDYSFPEGLWSVDVDEAQISQVVSNLIINADQAMAEGGTIWVSAGNTSVRHGQVPPLAEGDYVKVSFRDEGTGIPRAIMNKIFDPYFTTKKSGSGLGLSSTYSIIKNHGGHIAVESAPGRGTTFSIFLPASGGQVEKVLQRDEEFVMGTGKILVMDDDPEIRDSIGEVLGFLGYEVRFAADGREAIEEYRRSVEDRAEFDVVIMDLTVPGGMGGVEAMSGLRDISPSLRAIVSSGYSNDPIMSNYRVHGFSGFISKPYRIEELSRELQRVMKEGISS